MSAFAFKARDVYLAILLVLALVLRVYFAYSTPVGGAGRPLQLSSYNDELAHGSYANHVLVTGRLPKHEGSIQSESAMEGGQYENYQPPLYYVCVAGFSRLLGAKNLSEVIAVGRIINLAAGGVLLWLWLLIARDVGLDALGRIAGVAFVALGGVFVRFGAMCTNELFFWIAAGGMMLIGMRLMNHPRSLRLWTNFAAITVVGLYTKLSTIILLPLVILPVARARDSRVTFTAMLALLAVGVLTGPIWLRNAVDFGSLIPLSAGFGEPTWRIPGLSTLTYAIRSLVFPWSEFWRGWLGVLLLTPIIIILLIGVRLVATRRKHVGHPIVVTALLLSSAAYLFLNLRYHQAEARYLYAAWPALVVLAAWVPWRVQTMWVLILALLMPYLLMITALGA